jgi:parallel beta-helix repeat protein
VLGNAARRNGSYGIWAAGGSTVSGNSVYENGDDGILAGPGCTVSGNTVNSNAGDGLEVREGASVQNNTVRSNGGHGLNLLANDVTYRENTITNNSGGTVTGGLDMGANSCNGNVTCP